MDCITLCLYLLITLIATGGPGTESLKTVVNRGMQKHPSEAEVSCGENLLDKTNGIAKRLVYLLWVVLLFSFDYS